MEANPHLQAGIAEASAAPKAAASAAPRKTGKEDT